MIFVIDANVGLGLRGTPVLRAPAEAVSVASGAKAPVAALPMVTLTIDGQEVETPAGSTILQACELAGVTVPRFCYHERLSIAGNCRMCLVEVAKSPKLQASCAMPVAPGMEVFTDTAAVRKAREGILELLLVNHPLDCPICDQGGECDLQDQAMVFGSDRGRFTEYKRAVEDKNCGPLVKTIMTRCIHCTRCIRFSTEIGGIAAMGTTGRGSTMEVGTYVERMLDSELSGNLVDLCPVGALTSKPYAFLSRPWELKSVESVDVMDAVGSNIRIDSRGYEIMRVLPRLHEDINEEWISDKTRFAHDGLKHQRLNVPLHFDRATGNYAPTAWADALKIVAREFAAASTHHVIFGPHADAEGAAMLRDIFQGAGLPWNRQDLHWSGDSVSFGGDSSGSRPISLDCRESYAFASGIAPLEDVDVCLLVGTNPRWEAPLINARLRKRYLQGGFTVGNIGAPLSLTYPTTHLGLTAKTLEAVASGEHPFHATLASAKNPVVILGGSMLERQDGEALVALVNRLRRSIPALTVNLLHRDASAMGLMDLGIFPTSYGSSSSQGALTASSGKTFVYVYGDDRWSPAQPSDDLFIVYQGHSGDRMASYADVVLPGSAYTEKEGSYVNVEGRNQRTRIAALPPGESREDWRILRALAEVLGQESSVEDASSMQQRLETLSPTFAQEDEFTAERPWIWDVENAHLLDDFSATEFQNTVLESSLTDFYMTDTISRLSPTMAQCSATLGASAKHSWS